MSIENQTFKNFEVICINDGSTDGSLEIIKKFLRIDTRFKLINKKNTGYGNSMNCGIKAAKGDYIGIVESDDFIDENMYEILYEKSNNGKIDIVKANFYEYYDSKSSKNPYFVLNKDRENIIEDKKFTFLENPEISWFHPSIWSAIYKRKLLSKNNILFKEEKSGGWVDNPFFYETLCSANSILYTNIPLYYYRKTNINSSSNLQKDFSIPFKSMHDNLDVLEKNNIHDDLILKVAYARALVYSSGALKDFDYDAHKFQIDKLLQDLMMRLDENIILKYFNHKDQVKYYSYISPKRILNSNKKILIYNWVPFDNPWQIGGGVTIYCKNLIEQILKERSDIEIFFLSSGFSYDATRLDTFYRKIDSIFGDRVHQYEIVNSPVPASQRMIYRNPLIALKNKKIREVFYEFCIKYGEFKVIHFNNIEGISLDVLTLKERLKNTKFIFSLHNYIPICLTGTYYMRHKHCNCSVKRTNNDCYLCSRADIFSNISNKMYDRGKFNKNHQILINKKKWLDNFQFDKLDIDVQLRKIQDFAKKATYNINNYCDIILAVSDRVYEIAKDNGFSVEKMHISYIGTKVAEKQVGKQSYKPIDGLKIIYLGSDIEYEEKGYPFLLKALKSLDEKYARKIDLVLTVKQKEKNDYITSILKNYRSVEIKNGYTHEDFPKLFENVNLSIVPVLWEDNLPQIAIESVAYGVPVLASSAGGAKELSKSKFFIFKTGNESELLNKIIFFLNNPEKLNRYWVNFRKLVTLKDHCQELFKFYN